MVIIMFTIQQVYIGEKVLDQLTDEEGIKWYPLKSFLTRILCKYDKVSSFRDSAISRYMKVFEYNPNKPGAYRKIKMWFINENGVKYLLRHMEIRRVDNKHIYSSREKGFYEACLFFNVKPPNELDPLYINTPPNLKDYDIWSIMCIENDLKLKNTYRWKKCNECGYYYPDRVRYFGEKKTKNSKCLQCQGKNFKCQNKVIQFIYENDGLDLLYKMSLNNNEDIIRALKIFVNKGGIKDESQCG